MPEWIYSMPKIKPFECYADAYDEWYEKNTDVYEAELSALRQSLPSDFTKGVEIGAGTGRFSVPLGISIGLEPSREMAKKAESRGMTIIPGVGEHLPFENEKFDLVLMVTTICFLDDIISSFSETYRILKSGGCFAVGFIDKESELGRHLLKNSEKSNFYRDATFYSTGEVIHYLEKTGFKIAGIKQTLLSSPSPNTVISGFGTGAFVVIKGMKNPDVSHLCHKCRN